MDCCLICCNFDDGSAPSGSSNDEGQLLDLFIIQVLFEVPQNNLLWERYAVLFKKWRDIRRENDREDGRCGRDDRDNGLIKLCDQCSKAVNQARSIYEELLESGRRFRKVQRKIVGVAKKRDNVFQENGDNDDDDPMVFFKGVRGFVNEKDYNSFERPLVLQELTLELPGISRQETDEVSNLTDNENGSDRDNVVTNEHSSGTESDSSSINQDEVVVKEEMDFDSDPHEGNDYADVYMMERDDNAEPVTQDTSNLQLVSGKNHSTDESAIIPKEEPCSDGESASDDNTDETEDEDEWSPESENDDNDSGDKELISASRSRSNKVKVKVPREIKTNKKPSKAKKKANSSGEGDHKCSNCPKMFSNKRGLVAHRRQAHGISAASSKFPCSEEGCGMALNSKDNLSNHLLKIHNLKPNFKCEQKYCTKAFFFKDQLERHISAVHMHRRTREALEEEKRLTGGVQCTICQKWYRKTGIRDHYKRNHKGAEIPRHLFSYPCPHEGCDKVYSNQGNLEVHLSKHVGMPQYKCRTCIRAFYSPQQLTRHEQSVHGADGSFVCETCGEGFRVAHYLQIHRYKFHSGKDPPPKRKFFPRPPSNDNDDDSSSKSPYVCPNSKCGREFKSTNYLYQHYRFVHQKKFRHQCDQCGEGMKSPYTLRLHLMKVHHIFQPSSSALSADAETSTESPENHQCPVIGCKRWYSQKVQLEHHIFKEHGETGTDMRYLCTFCGKKFSQKYKFVEHELIHKNKETRPFKCEMCGKGFTNRTNLRYHQLYTHKATRMKKTMTRTEKSELLTRDIAEKSVVL